VADEQRLKQITDRILSDLRAAVTEFRITEEEIHDAARFLDRVGQAGEFGSMLDIFFAVTSVIATQGESGGTTPNLAGPFYKAGAPLRLDGRLYEGEFPEGETPLNVYGRVVDRATGEPVPEAILDVWQADGEGEYDVDGYHLRGLITVNEDGGYAFDTVLPEGYEISAKGPTKELLLAIGQHDWRPAHIHLRVHIDDATPLQTQFFMGGARFLDSDPVDGVRSELIVEHRAAANRIGREARFDIELALDRPLPIRSHDDGPRVQAVVP
jgi:protocatechuate 3,4-dioxygenase beta subunit